MNILITGAAGFIGANLSMALLKNGVGNSIMGVDRIDDYYDVSLKHWRLQRIEEAAGQSGSSWTFRKCDISDRAAVDAVFAGFRPDIVVNLAAQAGVRYSIQAPEEYIVSNIVGFFNILEACRHSRDGGGTGVRHLVYASSSSVYGRSQDVPFSTEDRISSTAASVDENPFFENSFFIQDILFDSNSSQNIALSRFFWFLANGLVLSLESIIR